MASSDPRLDGARLKLKRAREHLHWVKEEVERVTGPGAYTVTVASEDDGRKHTWTLAGLRPLDPMLSLWIGDCLHNLRAGFDHISYELIRAAGLTPTRQTVFPLLAERPRLPVYIRPDPGPDAEAMRIVEDTQPYNWGGQHDPLALLDHLDIVDKHRELLPTVASIDIPYYGLPKDVRTVRNWVPAGPVRDGDVVMWAEVDPPQPPGMVDGHVVLTVKLQEGLIPTALHEAAPVPALLENIAGQLDRRIWEFDVLFSTRA
jgi:hypothetical protein